MKCSIDWETRSGCDLKKEGAYRYATDPTTGIYVLGYVLSGHKNVWTYGEPFPEPLIDFIENDGIFYAWNAQFERLIWWYILSNDPQYDYVPEPELWQFRCTAAQARAHGLPGALDDAARCLDLPIRKDKEGDRLIKEYSAHNIPWDMIPQQDQRNWQRYVIRDVETEMAVANDLRELTETEWDEFYLNEEINDKGVPVDMRFVDRAAECADYVRNNADKKCAHLTNGNVTTTRQRTSRDAWVLPKLNAEQLAVLDKSKKDEPAKYSFEEARRTELLADPDLDERVRTYLDIVEEGGGAAVRKYKAVKDRQIDGSINGVLLWNGAGQTGRFSSRGLQMHNMKRAKVPDAEEHIESILRKGINQYENPAKVLSSLVRSAIYTPKGLSWFDWSSIEGRVAPWLADSKLGEAKLNVYRRGEDPYKINAASTFRMAYDDVDDESPERQAGKVQELALQFLGGVGALRVMALGYGMKISKDEAQPMVDSWRAVNPWAIKFGDQLNVAAIKAVQHPEQIFTAGRVQYVKVGNYLWCVLPCGRLLAYIKPRVEKVKTPWGKQIHAVTCVWGAAKPKVGEKWPRRSMHRGLWIENNTQAASASLLREALPRAIDAGIDVRLHVHDELIAMGYCMEKLGEIMLHSPDWAEGLPLAGSGGSGERYGK